MERATPREKLPPELTDMVIDQFYLSDESDGDMVRALRTCSLVCRAWLPRCRAMLFRSIAADDAFMEPLERLLRDSPHLGQYVKELELIMSKNKHVALLYSIAGHLGAVVKFGLTWRAPSPPRVRSLSSIGHVSTLCLDGNISSLLELVEYFEAFPKSNNITIDLNFTNALMDDNAALHTLADALCKLHPERIQVADSTAVLLTACLRLRPDTGVREIDCVPLEDGRWGCLDELLPAAASSMQTFGFAITAGWDSPKDVVEDLYKLNATLRTCSELRRLSFYIHTAHIGFIAELFSHLIESQVRSVEVVVDFEVNPIPLLDIKYIAQALDNKRSFPILRDIRILVRGYPDVDRWRLIAILQGLRSTFFSAMEARGISVLLEHEI
ncbi:hypothetical protein OBBRIDRAFT_178097 [Obba rivulosa]|uniref:F-box domain-containing protein n=1 Tax=Obba rivulosa TaxID=1052685 RepID=A0A8E2DIR3_9APHY|nr:hypothetical protein OBBRIDRAFT_178097 [Obba rivulosa]